MFNRNESEQVRPSARAAEAQPLVPVKGRRRTGVLIGGCLLGFLGALMVAWLVGTAGDRKDVVVVARQVPYGQAVTRDDLTTTQLSVGSGVVTVPASQVDAVVGQVASSNLVAGSLLNPAAVAPPNAPGKGQALVPFAVPLERMPAGGLAPGDHVSVLQAQDAVARPKSVPAVVERVSQPDADGITHLDLVTTADQGEDLAVIAASDSPVLVVLPAQG